MPVCGGVPAERLYTGGRGDLQFGDDDDLDAGLDIAVDLDRDLVGAERLYRLLHADPAPVDAHAAGLLDCVGDVGGGDGAEEALVLAGAGLDGYDALVEGRGDLPGAVGGAAVAPRAPGA